MRWCWRCPLKDCRSCCRRCRTKRRAARLESLLAKFSHSPLTGIHLWFDREITELDHAVLLDTTMQWLYNTSRIQPERQSMRTAI